MVKLLTGKLKAKKEIGFILKNSKVSIDYFKITKIYVVLACSNSLQSTHI